MKVLKWDNPNGSRLRLDLPSALFGDTLNVNSLCSYDPSSSSLSFIDTCVCVCVSFRWVLCFGLFCAISSTLCPICRSCRTLPPRDDRWGFAFSFFISSSLALPFFLLMDCTYCLSPCFLPPPPCFLFLSLSACSFRLPRYSRYCACA